MKVLVLNGGESAEREVSLSSGENVAEALQVAGYEVTRIDTRNLPDGELRNLCDKHDVVFIALHGEGGEDGTMQAKLDEFGVTYVGSGANSSRICMSKFLMRQRAALNNFMIASGELVEFNEFKSHALTKKPYVIKPDNGGSSIDTFIVRDVYKAPLMDIEKTFNVYDKMIIEELIEGTEITVGVLGENALPVIEIIPPTDQEFDYSNKYNGATQELCPPVNVSSILQKEAQKIALRAHRTFDCRHMSRTDFMIRDNGELIMIDINTIPGLTAQSLLPKAALQAGLDMPHLVATLVKFATT